MLAITGFKVNVISVYSTVFKSLYAELKIVRNDDLLFSRLLEELDGVIGINGIHRILQRVVQVGVAVFDDHRSGGGGDNDGAGHTFRIVLELRTIII